MTPYFNHYKQMNSWTEKQKGTALRTEVLQEILVNLKTHPMPILDEDYTLAELFASTYICSWAGLRNPLEPWSRAARKWRENEEMKRKWRD